MKSYERQYEQRVPREEYLMVRLDGRCFSSFTRRLNKPYDHDFGNAMAATVEDLCRNFHPNGAYTQSDEITLFWAPHFSDDQALEHPFDGRVVKLASVLAGFTSARFCHHMKVSECHFDARVFGVASAMEVHNNLLWRQRDCARNSVSSLAQCHFSAKQLHGKHRGDQLAMLREAGVDYDGYPIQFRLGALLKRVHATAPLVPDKMAGPGNADGDACDRPQWRKLHLEFTPDLVDELVARALPDTAKLLQ